MTPRRERSEHVHGDSPRAVVAALAANLGIALTKFAAFLITGSASLLAESVHSVADSANQVLLLVGRARSRREETEEHPFGFGAERYVYAFIVAVVLFVVGAIFSVLEGISRISHPEHLVSPAVAFAVLGIAIGLEAFSFRTAISESGRTRGAASWRAFIRHAKAPELPVVLLEDFAALIGLGFALIAVILTTVTGNPRWDGAGSLAIGLLLGCVAVVLATEMKSLLVGESAAPDVQRAILSAIVQGADIERVIHLRTLHVGPESLLVAAKIAVRPGQDARRISAAIDAAEQRIRAAVPIAGLIFLEPDLYAESRLDPADPAVRAARLAGEQPGAAQAGTPHANPRDGTA
ncbi:MAG TPA: cation diffusion facilitator family transporter [Streptosporangiaceae bacterium]|nr:cation diffusion facilitator family transporter [Streptosporangiaceae bacterium]